MSEPSLSEIAKVPAGSAFVECVVEQLESAAGRGTLAGLGTHGCAVGAALPRAWSGGDG